MNEGLVYLLLGSFAVGLLGALLGAWAFSRRARLRFDAPSSAALSSLQSTVVQRLPQLVQQAIQLELEYLAQQQAQRDEARSDEQRLWQADQDRRRAEELQLLRRALEAAGGVPAVDTDESEIEVTDEELDAMPPELPAPAKPRKRIVAPKAPTMQKL
jgi:hypothetical protein